MDEDNGKLCIGSFRSSRLQLRDGLVLGEIRAVVEDARQLEGQLEQQRHVLALRGAEGACRADRRKVLDQKWARGGRSDARATLDKKGTSWLQKIGKGISRTFPSTATSWEQKHLGTEDQHMLWTSHSSSCTSEGAHLAPTSSRFRALKSDVIMAYTWQGI
eukprot:5903153-Pleurochrysis_carterae.AAC.1